MDRAPQQGPGEGPDPQGSSDGIAESPDLKDQLEHQRVVIAQFKEMLQKTDQSNASQEKVDRYASTLSKMTMRAKRSKLKKESGGIENDAIKPAIETPVNDIISLLRRQLEENKVKLAERGKSQKDIEEMVHQLKAQFDDSLQLINDTSSNFSILESKTDYNKSSSSEELYDKLIAKEKLISDLNCKVQKLETIVLDLQENLKEKDCVIDARTKAITLMSESLLKKTKNTLDNLDDTKEHMKKMQEDFVHLEKEMKARQIKLLDDMRLKNLEIAELQEINQNLRVDLDSGVPHDSIEINDLKTQIAYLSNQIKELQASNSSLTKKNEELSESKEKNEDYKRKLKEQEEISRNELECKQKNIDDLTKIIGNLKLELSKNLDVDVGKKQADEVETLKTDLDNLNKDMIEVKSEHKKKLKLLNKKIDCFKKMGDMNAHIVKLSEENDYLNERIAELEEEKRNDQFKMMEGSKDNTSIKQKIKLESEIQKKMSDIHNEKVTTEMSFIQYEEKLQKENEDILCSNEKLQIENNKLLENLEILTKEKLELHSRLEQYLQENMELIDKLEKMSAEKVSSAESIEIVETLTMQEKLELDEYQKNLDPQTGRMKTSDEHLEENPDLNDSVNRLTEETSELLQKIELFTVERREVMEKMDSLSTENAHLNLKLKQLENNTELLTETYEQLQSEKKKLDDKLESMEKENEQLKNVIARTNGDHNIDVEVDLKQKLSDLEEEFIKLGEENKNLNLQLKNLHEKNDMVSQFSDAEQKIIECEAKISKNLEEIRVFQSVIEENKEEFIKFSVQLNDLREIISEKDFEIKNLNIAICNYNETLNKLDHESKNNRHNEITIENMEKQISNLKKVLDKNLEQIADYENELKENSSLMKQLNQQLKELSNKNLELQNILDSKTEEEKNIITILNGEIKELQSQIKVKDEMFHKVSIEMKDKFVALQEQTYINTESIEDIREPLQKKIEELTSKNNTLIERMKKIAANLKRKTINCQELEKQFSSSEEKWESESKEKDLCIREAQDEILKLKAKADLYQSEINQLKNIVAEKMEKEKFEEQSPSVKSDLSHHEELLESDFVQEAFMKDNENKIQELELIVETQLKDLGACKEKISRLEEILSEMDEKREFLEQKTNEFEVQLAEKSHSFEEMSKTEDILEKKLHNLSKYKEQIEKELKDFTENNEKLTTKNTNLKESVEKLKQKLIIVYERVNELSAVEENSSKLEEKLNESRNHVTALEQEVQKFECVEASLRESAKLDLEKLNNDWQHQFDLVTKEKLELSVLSQKLNERIAELVESKQVLLEKNTVLEAKLERIEHQAFCDFEPSPRKDEIQALKDEVKNKNEEINSYIIEIKKLRSTEQIELNTVDDLKKENEILQEKLNQISQRLSTTENLLFEEKQETEDIRSINNKLQNYQLHSKYEESEPAKSPFAWSDEGNDSFSFVKPENPSVFKEDNYLGAVLYETKKKSEHRVALGSRINIQELSQIFRTLEFMLKHAEIEKDEVMNQCSYLSNELMNIFHHFGGAPVEANTKTDSQGTQDQISNLKTVKESPLQMKIHGYDPHDEVKVLHSIKSHILSEGQVEPSVHDLQTIEYTETSDITDCTNPFVESPIQKTEAYLCYPENVDRSKVQSDLVKQLEFSQQGNQALVNINTFGENDDGWGWSPEEAKLEEIQNHEFETNPSQLKIVQLEDKVRTMEIESHNKQKEVQELEVKCVKLIKKLKGLKVQNERLQKCKKQDDHGIFSLESAIQDELKLQVETLEKRMSEICTELTKEKNEKQTLQKNIEFLSAANQRMIDMKEKNDIEMLMWKRRNEELQSKLGQFEWKESEGTTEKIETSDKVGNSGILELQKRITEMYETIKELTLDNEELQVLLKEQRTLRITAEKAKSVEPVHENIKTEGEIVEVVKQELEKEMNRIPDGKTYFETEFNEIIIQKQNIEDQLKIIFSENETLRSELNCIIATIKNEKELTEITDQNQIIDELNEIITAKKKLQDDLNHTIQRNDEQKEELKNLLEEKSLMGRVIEEKESIISKLVLNSEQNNEDRRKLIELETERAEGKLKIQELLERINHLDAVSQIDTHISRKKALLEEIEVNNYSIDSSQMEHLIEENLELTAHQQLLEERIQNLLKQIQVNDAEFQDQLQKLNQDWQALVDKRGSDVADSWKIHLDMRETEFDQLEKQLRKEINDLEEKCDGLVNENNELRKNVDTEIRNGIDRVSALQQQIHEYQQSINELSLVLKDKQQHIESLEQEIIQDQNRLSYLKSIIDEKDMKMNELQIIIDTTQKQLDEKRVIVEGVVKLLEEKSLSPILFDLESINIELKRQVINPDDLSNLQKDLKDQQSIISNIENELAMKVHEITNYETKIHKLESEIFELKRQMVTSNLEDKINSKTTELENKGVLLSDIQTDYNTKVKELEEVQLLNIELKNFAEENERNMKEVRNKLTEKEAIISNLKYELEETLYLKACEEESTQNLHHSLQQCQLQCDELRSTLDEKCSLIDIMNAELEKQHKIHVERGTDMEKLKVFVEELQMTHCNEKEILERHKNERIMNQDKEITDLQSKLKELELYDEELKSEKEEAQGSVNYFRAEIQDRDKNIMEMTSQMKSYKSLNDELSLKLNKFEELHRKYEEQNMLINEEEKQMDELKAIIENQVVKIEKLKEKLFEKSNDYDSLNAELDIRKDLTDVSEASEQIISQKKIEGPLHSDDSNDWVTRSELDIALYMLHQRDVRCEELTVELTQLLEERDTLQLRLSNALREKEEYRRVLGDVDNTAAIPKITKNSPSKGAVPKGKVSDIFLNESGTEIATEAGEVSVDLSGDQLENKLSELKNIGYKRDKTLLDEQQQRRLQQLSIMQQHIDEASKLPPEAAARLVDANYTLSRDIQSPSKVLLNWLWGRSTPKVNDL